MGFLPSSIKQYASAWKSAKATQLAGLVVIPRDRMMPSISMLRLFFSGKLYTKKDDFFDFLEFDFDIFGLGSNSGAR